MNIEELEKTVALAHRHMVSAESIYEDLSVILFNLKYGYKTGDKVLYNGMTCSIGTLYPEDIAANKIHIVDDETWVDFECRAEEIVLADNQDES